MDKKTTIRARIARMEPGEEVRFQRANARSISATCSQIASAYQGEREYKTVDVQALEQVIVWRTK